MSDLAIVSTGDPMWRERCRDAESKVDAAAHAAGRLKYWLNESEEPADRRLARAAEIVADLRRSLELAD